MSSKSLRHAVYARNRTCIYPECNRPAEQCQLDHRIPYDEGGPTEADNLYPLNPRRGLPPMIIADNVVYISVYHDQSVR